MSEQTFVVEGMTCAHCVNAVSEEVGRLPGVTRVDVDLDSGRVIVAGERPVADADVRAAVEEAGYAVTA